ncbi:MAG: hypothetical protein FWE05_04500 [Defluviitaleaceae bacterium]|nr:hypothetical protein [Defluviitaleaceae bacterium]
MDILNKFRGFFESKTAFYGVLLLAMIFTTFPFGFRYFAFSDDWFSLGIFSLYTENIWRDAVLSYGLHGFRPLAGLLEVYIVSAFWPSMWIILLAITLLRFFTMVLLEDVFIHCNITWGRVAIVFFAFFPTLTESTYWLSASVRIVPSGFLGVLTAYALLKFLHEYGHKWLILVIISGILAQGFYEQGIIFTFVLTLGVLILHRDKVKHKVLFALPFVNVGMIGLHYFIFRNVGWLGARVDSEVDFNFIRHIPIVTQRIARVFVHEQLPTFTNTLRGGILILGREYPVLFIIAVVLSVALATFLIFEKYESPKNLPLSLFAGVVLGLSTMAVFFVLADGWVWVRNFYFLLLGFAVLFELLARATDFSKWWFRIWRGILAGLCIFVFISGYILEVHSLRSIHYYDDKIIQQLADRIEELAIDTTEEVWLLGLRWTYAPTISPRLTSQLRIDWAANAHYRYVHASRNGLLGTDQHHEIVPVMNGQRLRPDFAEHHLFAIDSDLQVREIEIREGLEMYNLYFADNGEAFGIVSLDVFWRH